MCKKTSNIWVESRLLSLAKVARFPRFHEPIDPKNLRIPNWTWINRVAIPKDYSIPVSTNSHAGGRIEPEPGP